MAEIKYWLWLSALGLSPKATAALMRRYSDAEAVFYAPADEYAALPSITKAERAKLQNRELGTAARILSDCHRLGIDIITLQDARYPGRLRDIPDAPAVLYVKGTLPDVDSEPAVAVIGTRQASPYGLKMCRRISFEMAKSGAVLISMLSEGIDRECARSCVFAGGSCVGVMGTAIDEEKYFYKDILGRGALISEYPPGMESRKHFFRERNRIAAALCHGLVVVEAPERSGALLFAAEALEQGRGIFAVPGNADSSTSVGTNQLIKQGAKPVTNGWDVLEDFEYLFPNKLKRPDASVSVPELDDEKSQTPPKAEKATVKDIDKPAAPGYIDLREQLSELSEPQLKIISSIGRDEVHVDEIIQRSGLSTAAVLAQLTILETKGYVRRSPGRRYSLNIKSK